MLPTLIRQQFLSHLMSARFFAAVIITLLLVVFKLKTQKIRQPFSQSSASLYIERVNCVSSVYFQQPVRAYPNLF